MKIIAPKPSDFARLLVIWEASVRATHTFLREQDIQDLLPVVLAALEQVELYSTVDAQGTLCGFIGVLHDKIEMLFVHPHSFKQGCGKALIQHVERKQKIRYVDVNEQNPQAVAFYTHLGFQRIGRSAHDGQGRDFPILHLAYTEDALSKEHDKKDSYMSDTLAFSTKNCWETYAAESEKVAMDALATDYMAFLSACKTERETVERVATLLREAGYSEDFAKDCVFRVCRDKAVFVARRGKRPLADGVRLISAHTDAPRLDCKQHPLVEQVGVGQAKTHYYGGIRKYQWLARPLALHGVVVREDGSRVTVNLGEAPEDPVFTIADLLPHLAQKENTKTVADAFEGEKLNVIMGHSPFPKVCSETASQHKEAGQSESTGTAPDSDKDKDAKSPVRRHVLALLHERYAICEEDLFSAELQVVPAGPARFVGLDSSIIGGYAQDDRVCVYTALRALLDAEQPEYTACLMFWDKEEIGSEGSTGAQSRFLENCLQDVAAMWEPKTLFRHFIAHSKALSADVHGALDPDWQDLHEKNNAALLGHGPCFCKFTGSRGKYGANDAHPEYVGWLRGVLNRRGIPWQMAELGKVDGGGGGTVALYLAAYGMDVIDCGPALLGMHSPFELASKADVYATKLAYTAFFEER